MGNTDSTYEQRQVAADVLVQDDQSRKQELYRQNLYLEDPEELTQEFKGPPPLIIPEIGYRTELGGILEQPGEPALEEVEKHSLYYRDNFCNREHINFAGGSSSCPVIISAIPIEKVKGVTRWRVLYRNKKGDNIVELNAKNKGNLSKQLRTIAPDLQGDDVPFFEVRDPELIEDLKHMEDRHLIKAYKFGVIYCKENEVDENDMFSNTKTSPEFEEFLSWMGEKVRLKGYKGFRGGLDVEHNTTGSHSYVTNFKGFDIMYHISTELPFDQKNPQQVERKRHIGNDVVVIVFQDGPNGGFKPSMITSKFNHVYVVIQPVKDKRRRSSSARQKKPNVSNDERIIKRTNSKKKNTRQTSKEHIDTSTTKYRISIVSKRGVKCHGPVLPNNKYVWPKNDQTREYLLTKLINSERAAYYAPDFGQARTRRLWLKELLEKYQARLSSK